MTATTATRRRRGSRWLRIATAAMLLTSAAACAAPVSAPQAPPDSAASASRVAQPPGASCPPADSPFTSGRTQAFGVITLRCLRTGPAVALDHLGGSRPVLVNLWASWCVPCQREMPRLQRAARIGGPRLLVLGVDTLDSTDSARSFLRAVGSTYPQVNDPAGAVRTAVHAVGLPATFVIQADGTVGFHKLGELTAGDLVNALRAAGVTVATGELDGKQT